MSLLDGWRVCPRCGHELERARAGGHLGVPRLRRGVLGELGAGGAGRARARRPRAARRGGRSSRGAGYWDLPGGFLEEGEEPLDGLRREFREETGLEVEPVEWLGAFVDPYDRYFVLGLTWIVRGDGEPVAADDVAELAWFAPDELPGRDGVREPGARARALWASRAASPEPIPRQDGIACRQDGPFGS